MARNHNVFGQTVKQKTKMSDRFRIDVRHSSVEKQDNEEAAFMWVEAVKADKPPHCDVTGRIPAAVTGSDAAPGDAGSHRLSFTEAGDSSSQDGAARLKRSPRREHDGLLTRATRPDEVNP